MLLDEVTLSQLVPITLRFHSPIKEIQNVLVWQALHADILKVCRVPERKEEADRQSKQHKKGKTKLRKKEEMKKTILALQWNQAASCLPLNVSSKDLRLKPY